MNAWQVRAIETNSELLSLYHAIKFALPWNCKTRLSPMPPPPRLISTARLVLPFHAFQARAGKDSEADGSHFVYFLLLQDDRIRANAMTHPII